MDLPRRKANRLKNYDYSRPGYYFVTICTLGRRHILGTVVGADVLIGPYVRLTPVGQTVNDVLAQMPATKKYVVMPNHIHIIFRIGPMEAGPMGTSAPTRSIPMLVRYLKRRVTVSLGEKIFQDDYYDHIIRSEADYLRIWNYIDTNPAKWREDCYYTEAEE